MGAARYLSNWISFLKKYDHWRFLFAEWNKQLYLRAYLDELTDDQKQQALQHAAKWLIESCHQGSDDGSGTYYFNHGWTSSYPETTGYIIPTLLDYAESQDAAWALEAHEAAKRAGHWLLSIQHEDGGWPGGYVHQKRPSVVFNSGQILRGLLALHQRDPQGPWSAAAKKCIDWILAQMDDQGVFSKNDFMGAIRVYGTYVMAPVLSWAQYFPEAAEEWKSKARLHAKWVMSQQNSLGWFANCDNTRHKNNRPIIHTIAYTADGLWHLGIHLDDKDIQAAAMVPARTLATEFLTRGMLSGRYDDQWSGSESFIPTGGAQLAILWDHMYDITNEAIWKAARDQMNNLLVVLARRGARESSQSLGALPGSFPMWGRYETFGLPNWATKYFVDSLLNEQH